MAWPKQVWDEENIPEVCTSRSSRKLNLNHLDWGQGIVLISALLLPLIEAPLFKTAPFQSQAENSALIAKSNSPSQRSLHQKVYVLVLLLCLVSVQSGVCSMK